MGPGDCDCRVRWKLPPALPATGPSPPLSFHSNHVMQLFYMCVYVLIGVCVCVYTDTYTPYIYINTSVDVNISIGLAKSPYGFFQNIRDTFFMFTNNFIDLFTNKFIDLFTNNFIVLRSATW